MPTLFRNLRSALPAAVMAFSLAASAPHASAQSGGTTIQRPFDIGLTFAQKKPYNFTGRIFDLDFFEFGSGTLIRRHTVLTAGHVVYSPDFGFTTVTTFTRGLYKNYSLSKQQVISVAALSGYQAAADLLGPNSLAAFQQDLGYLLVGTAPVDEDWAVFTSNPALLTNRNNQFFVLGYPGSSFDGRTLAYVVPNTPYVPAGTSTSAGIYESDEYQVEGGMSGGPVYVVINNDPNQRYVAAETTAGADDTSGEFNATLVRAIDPTVSKFLTNAEYASGLVKRVQIAGPTTVARGTTATFTVTPIFKIPTVDGRKGSTNRYSEIKVKSSAVPIPGQPKIKITKTSNTTVTVTVPNVSSVRPGSQVTLQAYYDFDQRAIPAGKSSFTFTIQ